MTSLHSNAIRFVLLSSFLLGACGGQGGAAGGTSQSTDRTSPTGVTPSGFCSSRCIAEDQDKCLDFAERFSDAFLAAFETCGDNPACLEPKLDAAPRTARQQKLAADYCAKCAADASDGDACVSTFFVHDQAGGSLAMMSDARLDAVEEKCFPELKGTGGTIGELTCRTSLSLCAIQFLQEDAGARMVCRARQ